ncbi:hypothetical protein ACFWQD_17625 [Alcaligenes faecalis]|uniref:hypothetical protein n=1 Tax=Alcaligenes faecalis TaxID=511 RepID=UPI00364984C3
MKTGLSKLVPFSTPQYAADGWVDDTPARNTLSNSAKGPYLQTFISFSADRDHGNFIRNTVSYRYDRDENPFQ